MDEVLVILVSGFDCNPIEALLIVPEELVLREKWDELHGLEVQSSQIPQELADRMCDIWYRANVTQANHRYDSVPSDPSGENVAMDLHDDSWKTNPGPERDLYQYVVPNNQPMHVKRVILMSFNP